MFFAEVKVKTQLEIGSGFVILLLPGIAALGVDRPSSLNSDTQLIVGQRW